MTLAHITSVRNTLCNTVVDLLDIGAGAQGDTQIGTAAFAAILATVLFEVKGTGAFGAAAAGIATMTSPPREDSSATGGGTAVTFRCRDAAAAEVFQGTVGAIASGADMELSSTLINPGDAVRFNSFTYASSP